MNPIYKARPLGRKEIRQLANIIRKITGYDDIIYFPIVEFMELCLPEIVPGFFYEICKKSEMPNKCGETFPAEKKIVIREDIYLKAINGDGFSRYCLAHEVGHLLINTIDSVSLCRLAPGEKLKAYESPEWQADAFGGELLMPHSLIKNMSPEKISKACGVTLRAASVQKSNVHKCEQRNIKYNRRWR